LATTEIEPGTFCIPIYYANHAVMSNTHSSDYEQYRTYSYDESIAVRASR